MSQPKLQITSGRKEYIDRSVQLLTSAFDKDPIFRWLLHNLPPSEYQSVLSKIFRAFLTQGSLNNGVFFEVGDFGCCSLLMPPGGRMENSSTMLRAGLIPYLFTIGPGPLKRALFEYTSEPMLKKAFTKEEQKMHWYVFIMGTATDRRRQGLAGALLVHMQDQVRNDGRPLWLEATTKYSRDFYSKHGFETVGEPVLGKGYVGPDGLTEKNGEGVTIWPMFWRP
ncbi:hypothetical protein F4818DRAFT_118939 [Hypoxylon cercidicola]|nr:hypothetical protein F4818DRAFT_118939 [Hypoxylon cercidicola]